MTDGGTRLLKFRDQFWIHVAVLDKNDSPPTFGESTLKYTISEDFPVNHKFGQVIAKDPDLLGTLTYSLLSGHDGKFSLDSASGGLSLRQPLDREVKNQYAVIVEAHDGQQGTSTTVHIEVIDTNDNPPLFTQPAFSFDVSEHAERNAKVGTVEATDLDEETNGLITYSVISDWGNDVLSLNPRTGVFTLNSQLDYEQTQHYIFVVQAQDAGLPPLSSTVTVYFNVLDENDNAPVFDPLSYSDEVLEDIPVGTEVLTVSATDQDAGINGKISYSIVGGDDNGTFSINDKGIITTKSFLDRERQSIYNLVVMATDLAQPLEQRLSSSVQVTILLQDVNDMLPEFVTPNVTSIPENSPLSTVVMAIKAVDRDEGRNSYVEYFLESSQSQSTFVLGSTDGLLRLAGPLDREQQAEYSLTVTAKDRGVPSNSQSKTLIIEVLDENDNAPIFDPNQYSASVAENASLGLSVLKVSATDADSAMNSRIRYTIIAGDNNRDFSIEEDTGVIRVSKNLNYERKNHYLITVEAEDSGLDARFDSATVTISILDINDNEPVFLNSPYLIYVMENMVDLPIVVSSVVKAHDSDNSPYNSVSYLLKDGDRSLFAVNSSSGDIKLLKALDREVQDRYFLTVIAMDTGSPRLTGTGSITVVVQDENDHSPSFTHTNYQAEVAENLDSGIPVMTLTATDKDLGLNAAVSYSIIDGAAESFTIDSESGIIRTNRIFDREEISSYILTIQAKDSALTGARTTSTEVMIRISDVNDNKPLFSAQELVIHLPYPTQIGDFVFGEGASDKDYGENERLIYHLSGPDASYFQLNQHTGIVKVSSSLEENRSYEVIVGVQDFGTPSLSSSIKLNIFLKPSAQFPVFRPVRKEYSFNENEKDVFVGKFQAALPNNIFSSKIRYRIAGGNLGNAFEINENSGELLVSPRGLDFERTKQYHLYLSAEDGNVQPLSSYLQISINVSDYNDNRPMFTQTEYNSSVMEDLPPSQLVATVAALDEDSGKNSELSYKLKGDNNNIPMLFSIDNKTGEIRTLRTLKREEMSRYELLLEAIDKGSPALTGSATLVVNVRDKNNNPPRFTRLFSVNVTENAEIGSFVIQVTSSDRDIGSNANVTYSFTKNPDKKFHIDPGSGNVTVAEFIDREQKDEYYLKVSASDGSWKAETPLTISVQDENDNYPIFEEEHYDFTFPESEQVVVFVGQVKATDKDKIGPNSIVSYALKFPSDFFTIDSSSGEILSKHNLKYKHSIRYPSPENEHHLTIVATDNGKPPRSSEVSVVINVVDTNNNEPKFEKSNYLSPVLQNVETGRDILQIKAIDDKDFGINAQISYEITHGNGSKYFSLDHSTGWIRVKTKLDIESGSVFTLHVKAKDKGVPPLHDESSITFVVTGENEHSPSFTASSYQVIIAENEKVGSTIGTVKAFDKDKGLNGVVRYYFTSGNDAKLFSMDEVSGSVKIMSELDYDTVNKYELNVTARDSGFHPQISTAKFTVILTDVNDNPPLFESETYEAYIQENSPIGTSLFTLEAKDQDSPSNAVIHYSIVGGNGRQLFSINLETGIVTSKRIFDYEEKDEYQLNVVASNPNSDQRSTAVIKVHVIGANEFYPKFVQPVFQFAVSESAQIGTSIGSLRATDEDFGDEGVIYYLLVGSSNDKGFNIDSLTGTIYVSRNLDREQQNRVILTVMAKNSGSIRGNDTDEAQIIVSIEDGNDPPVFDQAFYEARISESSSIGTKVITVNAIDSDVKQQDNQFTYTIIGGNLGKAFKIDPQRGSIRTVALVDREKIQVYNLTIGAIDSGTPPQTGTALVKVYIEDINDNAPQFNPSNLIGYIVENEPSMTSVMVLTATDPDLPPNTNPFSYFITGGEHRDFFVLNEKTGEVKTTRIIDREITPELNFIVEVRDGGKPQKKSEHFVTIKVIDKNDSPSTSRDAIIKVMSFDGKFQGGKVADIKPIDSDISGQYQCQIFGKSSPIFSIPHSCALHAESGFHDNTYSLNVIGNDGRFSNVTSKFTVEFESFDNHTLENSITIRMKNLTSKTFLELYYRPLLQTISRVFTKDLIHLISVSDSTGHTEVTLAAENLASDSYLDPRHLTDILLRYDTQLQEALKSLQYTINYNPCSDNPCKNKGICSSRILAFDEAETIDSPNVIFTSNVAKNTYVCQCQRGFEGSQCEIKQDPCNPNPCKSGGSCSKRGLDFSCSCLPTHQGPTCEISRTSVCDNNPCNNGGSCQSTLEGGFFCLCRPGFRGNQCELESESCRPNPCMNGGSCLPMRPGYQCSCPINYYGVHCEKSTFSFDALSFMSFPTLDSTTNDISVIFSTTKLNSLLVYNYGLQTGGRSDFVAMEILNGRPRFSFGGARTEITSVTVNRNVATGQWYKVTATRNGRVISLSVAECSNSGEHCKDCQPGDYRCYADNIGPTGTLNFNNEPMYFGGVMTIDPIQERPNQVKSDDFIGCIQSFSVNGRSLNFSEAIQQRGIGNTCRRTGNICEGNPCGDGNHCIDMWSMYKCSCGPDGILAPDCDSSLQPITLSRESYVEFEITEQYRRRQLLPQINQKQLWWRRLPNGDYETNARNNSYSSSKTLTFMFRTVEQNGILLRTNTNADYTMITMKEGHLHYSSKLGANDPFNLLVKKEETLDDGYWHNFSISTHKNSIDLSIDGQLLADGIKAEDVHDFLDAYLTSFTVGNVQNIETSSTVGHEGFSGCLSMLSINGEILLFNISDSSLLKATPHKVNFLSDCATFIGSAASTDPISVGITLVIVFFILLLIAICISFVAYRFRRQKKEKDTGRVFQNGSGLLANTSSDSGRTPHDSGYIESAEMTDDVIRSNLTHEIAVKKYKDREHERPQRPDIIEREVLGKVPHSMMSRVSENPHGDRDIMSGLCNIVESDQLEHYDLENASSIAPSDIDVVYHYKGYRDGNIRKYKTNPHIPAYHKHNHRHSPHNFPGTPHRESPRHILKQSPNHVMQRESPSMLKMQSTPLARLSPSSELSQQTPRIFTLQDLSGKPLQTALLATSQVTGMKDITSNSERSLNSPISHLSQSSGSIRPPSQTSKKKLLEKNSSIGLTAEEIDILNSRARNSSLLSTLDAVSSSSDSQKRKEKLAELLEANTELMEAPDSSSDESGNDSFTCSEFEYDNNYDKVTRDIGRDAMIFSKLAEVDNENDHENDPPKTYDVFDSFRGSLSTLVASDEDEISNFSSYKPPNGSSLGWEALLNWSPNYENLMGVFKDIAELPDGTGRSNNLCSTRPNEEYV